MTITVTPESVNGATPTLFRAYAGREEATGATVGAELDALTARLTSTDDDSSATLIVIERFQPDAFFTAAQQARLGELMDKLNIVRDQGGRLPPDEQAELESLIQDEVKGMGARAQALLSAATK